MSEKTFDGVEDGGSKKAAANGAERYTNNVYTNEYTKNEAENDLENAFEEIIKKEPELNAEALAKKAKAGDSFSFALLADKYHRFLLKYVASFNVPYVEREDLMQEGMIGLLKAVRSYDEAGSSFTTYAFYCMKSNIISALRRYSRQTKASAAEQSIDFSTSYMSQSPESAFIDKESTKQLHDRFFSALSDYEAKVFEMYLADIPYSEMCVLLNKDAKSVDNALQRIKSKLKKLV